LLDKFNKKQFEPKLEQAKREAETIKSEAKKNLQLLVGEFMESYS